MAPSSEADRFRETLGKVLERAYRAEAEGDCARAVLCYEGASRLTYQYSRSVEGEQSETLARQAEAYAEKATALRAGDGGPAAPGAGPPPPAPVLEAVGDDPAETGPRRRIRATLAPRLPALLDLLESQLDEALATRDARAALDAFKGLSFLMDVLGPGNAIDEEGG
jgi:hypothetical protein